MNLNLPFHTQVITLKIKSSETKIIDNPCPAGVCKNVCIFPEISFKEGSGICETKSEVKSESKRQYRTHLQGIPEDSVLNRDVRYQNKDSITVYFWVNSELKLAYSLWRQKGTNIFKNDLGYYTPKLIPNNGDKLKIRIESEHQGEFNVNLGISAYIHNLRIKPLLIIFLIFAFFCYIKSFETKSIFYFYL